MNTTFTLDKRINKVFPTEVRHNGSTFSINADFRNILRIIRMNNDTDVLSLQKPYLIAKWFFNDEFPDIDSAMDIFEEFMGAGDEYDRAQEPMFDFEFDAEEIYASFLKDYSIDLLEIPFMHWRKFLILLSNLSDESPFRQKIKLRFMDLTGYKGKELLKLMEAKEAVQIPIRYTKEELAEMAEFEAEWG